VAAEAGVSRPTLYRWFPSKGALLDAFGRYEQAKFDAGIAAVIEGLTGEARLDAVLRFIVEFQHSSSLRRMMEVEPEYVVQQMRRALPITRRRLLPYFQGSDAFTVATIVTRIALSHALLPDDDPDLFLRELRTAAGLPHGRSAGRARRRRAATFESRPT
jgi:AcrR family transcriptional regulator